MGRRIRWLGIVLIVLFGVVLFQLGNIQFHKAGALASDPKNRATPRSSSTTSAARFWRPTAPCSPSRFRHERVLQVPAGLSAGLLVLPARRLRLSIYGTNGIEDQYNDYLVAHTQPAQSLAQLLSPPPKTTDDVTLTINPTLQKTAQEALASASGVNKDGAIVALDPQTGAVLAMYSNPTYDPNPLASPSSTIQTEARLAYLAKDAEGFSPRCPSPPRPSSPRARRSRSSPPPRSTTSNRSSRTSRHRCSPARPCPSPTRSSVTTAIPHAGGRSNRCCRHRVTPLRPARHPGRRAIAQPAGPVLRLQHGSAPRHPRRCRLALPVGDRPRPGQPGVAGRRLLGHRPAGCGGERATNALVAAGIANHGTVMAPTSWPRSLRRRATSSAPTSPTPGRSPPRGHDSEDHPAHATGGDQRHRFGGRLPRLVTGGGQDRNGPGALQRGRNHRRLDDRPRARVNPTIAVAVVVPYQSVSATGAEVAGPIMKAMLEAAAALPAGS